MTDKYDQLEKLAKLRDQAILTENEFEKEKEAILCGKQETEQVQHNMSSSTPDPQENAQHPSQQDQDEHGISSDSRRREPAMTSRGITRKGEFSRKDPLVLKGRRPVLSSLLLISSPFSQHGR